MRCCVSEPNFVSSYEIGDFVYFFFRETAVEFINCGKVSLSVSLSVCLFFCQFAFVSKSLFAT